MTSSLTIPISARRRKFFEERPEPREEYSLLNGPEWTGFPPTAAGSIYKLSAHLRFEIEDAGEDQRGQRPQRKFGIPERRFASSRLTKQVKINPGRSTAARGWVVRFLEPTVSTNS